MSEQTLLLEPPSRIDIQRHLQPSQNIEQIVDRDARFLTILALVEQKIHVILNQLLSEGVQSDMLELKVLVLHNVELRNQRFYLDDFLSKDLPLPEVEDQHFDGFFSNNLTRSLGKDEIQQVFIERYLLV